MTNIIKHSGIVERVDGSHISVKIMQTSACAACKVKGYCSSADSQEKIIDIYDPDTYYKVGEEVMVYATVSMGMQAVLISFIIPFIIIMAVLFGMMAFTLQDELLSAVTALMSLIPYYIILYLFRNRLKKKFSFTLKPIK